MGNLATTTFRLTADVAPAGTVVIPAYPTGSTQASLTGTTGGGVALSSNDRFPQAASGAGTVAFTFGASTITITNNSGTTWLAGTLLTIGFGKTDRNGVYNPTLTQPAVTPSFS